MATVKPGKSGTFNGKIGDVVISKWKGLLVSRDVPTPSKKPKTLAQLDQQSKLKLVPPFFAKLSDIITLGYQTPGKNMTAMNTAIQAHLKTAIAGVYPNYTLDFTKVMITSPFWKTEIDGGYGATGVAVADAKVKVTWTLQDPPANATTSAADTVYLVFYDTVTQRFTLYANKALRSALTVTAQISRASVGHKFQGYMFFVSPDGKSVSFSEYLGAFTLIA